MKKRLGKFWTKLEDTWADFVKIWANFNGIVQ